ncbi:MAG: M20/M25/M40 family metallo-hydrolase [Gemmatimonadaceae bacterium]|nr:M20/M25/M40 family metallo-hydrolase [Gemmatimonadaceae bacterium]
MSRHLHAHAVIAAALLAMPCRLGAQPSTSAQRALASWIAFDAPTGEESRTTPNLVKPLEAATGGRVTVDALGNVIIRKGSGMPKRVVACAIDRPGFAVTQITRDGMLRLHRVGGASHQLWDQAHEGQQLEILTERGAVPAVAAIRNGHFVQQHSRDTLVVAADDLWVDVGARTAAEVALLGVRLLDPVQRRLASWTYASHAAGANAGARTGCAAIMAASRGTVSRGETMFVLSVQGVFGFPGLGGVLARQPDFRADSITVVVGARASRLDRWTRAAGASPVNEAVLRAADVEDVHLLAPAVRAAGTLVESIEIGEADWLLTQVVRAAGASDLPADPWITIPVRERRVAPLLNDPHAPVMRLLQHLADLPGVPGQEWRVREAIEAQLPAWAKAIATVDDAGNLIVSTGPARDTVVFMAHMDEVSYDVQSIARDGTVTLRGRGGVANSAWEGQAALLHLPRPASGVPDTLPGIFVPRDNGRVRTALTVTAFFGLDSAALVARGVRIGDGVTSPKTSVRLAGSRFTGRSMDDRAGSTALLLAVRAIDPKVLDHAVMFVWTTSEETGLAGAIALANRVGATVRRAYSIDTFVSSETPLESPHFAFVSLGGGPVLRAIETSSVSPRSIRRGVEAAARTARIPLQTGLTQGGTDGTAFTFFGAPNTGLSWPGRYSHTPAEVLDLQDLQQLATLIRALAMQRP